MILLLLACAEPVDTAAPMGWPDAGVLRLGPPTATVGIYGIAATDEAVYLSNLHVPFVTVVDPETGAWMDSIEVRGPTGERPRFARLYVQDEQLWITGTNEGVILRHTLDDHAALASIDLPDGTSAFRQGDEGLWIAHGSGITAWTDAGEGETLPVDSRPVAFDVSATRIATVDGQDRAAVWDRETGEPIWMRTVADATLEDVRLVGEMTVVTDRAGGSVRVYDGAGEIQAERAVGSDTFAVVPFDADLLVVNRQGAALPESGSYEGAPGTVVRLTMDLEPVWEVELGKTIHFLAFNSKGAYAANEDELTVSRFEPDSGDLDFTGPRVGLTLDHLQPDGWRVYAGSHLTDALWTADWEAASAQETEVCGWPFFALVGEDSLWVPCQESGEVAVVDRQALDVTETLALGSTLHPECEGGLCTGHAALIGGAVVDGEALIAEPRGPSLQWLNGAAVALDAEAANGDTIRHMGVVALGDALVVLQARDDRLLLVQDEVQAELNVPGSAGEWALIADQDRAWVGHLAVDAELGTAAQMTEGHTAVAAGAGFVVFLVGEDIVVYDRETLTERGRLSALALRLPPIEQPSALEPMRFAVSEHGELWVANVFQGTLERRALPDLGPCGEDEVVLAGSWD